MAWFFRAIELPDGSWACRSGLREVDRHDQLEHALAHLRDLAAESGPFELFAHRLDGTIEQVAP
jgi:hypothetical protein